MEEELAKHLKQLADQFNGLAPVKCHELAFEYAEKNNIPVPANWTEKQCAECLPYHSLPLLPQILKVSSCGTVETSSSSSSFSSSSFSSSFSFSFSSSSSSSYPSSPV
ncbi:unnamed protein product [Pleuronectes platessa]|uniref:Uncharacterized protein n=1 Tax=Pleuronectes platessa TaxID=8262 RepID=A0A9N7UC33_PLEPL|nr:unnamed protein product [Pleuronectes platessa]